MKNCINGNAKNTLQASFFIYHCLLTFVLKVDCTKMVAFQINEIIKRLGLTKEIETAMWQMESWKWPVGKWYKLDEREISDVRKLNNCGGGGGRC